jgi:hypothetical protein
VITQIERLGALKAQGVCLEDEFDAQQAKQHMLAQITLLSDTYRRPFEPHLVVSFCPEDVGWVNQ